MVVILNIKWISAGIAEIDYHYQNLYSELKQSIYLIRCSKATLAIATLQITSRGELWMENVRCARKIYHYKTYLSVCQEVPPPSPFTFII